MFDRKKEANTASSNTSSKSIGLTTKVAKTIATNIVKKYAGNSRLALFL
jgi:hypothetical protein